MPAGLARAGAGDLGPRSLVAIALACAALVGGCGGEVLPLPALEPLSPLACTSTDATVRVQLYGDSTQAGTVSGRGRRERTPAIWLQADMDALFGTGAVVVEDRAVPSTTARQLLDGTDGKNGPWPTSVVADIAVVNHGINDAGHGASTDEYKARLEALLIAPARVVLETPNPTKDFDMEPYAGAMREVAAARGAPLADTFTFVASLPGGGTSYLSDWAHPTEDLYGHIVRYSLVPTLVPLVSAKRCR